MRAILTFHSINDSGSVLSYPRHLLVRLLAGLARHGVPVLDLDALLDPGTAEGVALTFDDGARSVLLDALPVVRDHGAPAHLFLTTGVVGGDNRWPSQPVGAPRFAMLDWPEVERLQAQGFAIEGHTVTHPDLRALDDRAVLAECAGADEAIRQRLGRAPRYFAYPYGGADARVRRLVRTRYRAVLGTELRFLGPGDEPAALPRIDSYYLHCAALVERFAARRLRPYIALRHALRLARGR